MGVEMWWTITRWCTPSMFVSLKQKHDEKNRCMLCTIERSFFFSHFKLTTEREFFLGAQNPPNPPVVFHIKLWYNPSPWMIKIGWNLPRISHQPWWYSVATSNTGLGIDVPLCFTSPNYEGDISTPTDIWFGDRNKIPKKGHQSQPQLNSQRVIIS